ncbi:MAG: hypothetical protein ACRD0A_03950 [Acidimicrobiales bacterium]
MTWVFFVVAAVLVVIIALVAVGREAFTMGAQPRQAVFDLDEAVEFVAEHLPRSVTARLSYDEVRRLLAWHLEYLRSRGVPRTRETASDNGSDAVVIDEDEPVAYVLMRAEAAGIDADADDVVAVLDAETAYFTAIGAIGPEAA